MNLLVLLIAMLVSLATPARTATPRATPAPGRASVSGHVATPGARVTAVGHSLVELHAVRARGGATTRSLTLPATGETVVFERRPLVTLADVDSAWVVESAREPGRFEVQVLLEPGPGQRFQAYTAGHVGQRLAVVVRNRLAAAPEIRGRMEGPVPVALGLERAGADSLAAEILGALAGH